MAMKYIECRNDMLIKCKLKDGSTVDLYPFIMNKYTGTPEHTGFTAVTEEQLELLKRDSKAFNYFLNLKKIFVRDEIPTSVQTPQGLLASKDAEIAKLRQELAAANAALKAGPKAAPEPVTKDGPKKSKKEEAVTEDGAPAQF